MTGDTTGTGPDGLRVVDVRAGGATSPAVVATACPRLTWKAQDACADWSQHSAEIAVERPDHAVRTFLHLSAESVGVDWPDAPLAPHEHARVRVRVVGEDGSRSSWSDVAHVHRGVLDAEAWTAHLVGLRDPVRAAQPTLLRTTFEIVGPISTAYLYATARGVYQVEINGDEVDDHELKPGWTSYQYRLAHETTDVARFLRVGTNAVVVHLAGGWYTEEYGFTGQQRRFYGDQPAVALQLVVLYESGERAVIRTDSSWMALEEGPILESGIYAGEAYDARKHRQAWSEPGVPSGASGAWVPVRDDGPCPAPVLSSTPPVRRIETLPPRRCWTSPSGKTILDFGQNMVGRLRITVSGREGDTVVLRHAEVLEDDELGTRPLRAAKATDTYTLAGLPSETWEPRFTFHGFRYAEITGWPGEFDPAMVHAVVMHSDLDRTGWFECSEPMLNRLHENVVWGMRGNFLSIPSDCPQRDERLGWTGDIQVFSPTASYLFDCASFLAWWLQDLAAEQEARGGVVPVVVPDPLRLLETPVAAWGDAATVVPWVLYRRFGDPQVLRDQYASMRAWVDSILGAAGDRHLWEGQFQFGDWLDPDSPPDRPGQAKTDPAMVATAYLFRSACIVAQAAGVLGLEEESASYGAAATKVRDAFVHEYVTPAGRLLSDAPTAYAMVIAFEIVTDPELVRRMGDRLAELVRESAYHIGTGFVGTPLIQDVLMQTGHAATAERLLLQTEEPSWLYPVSMGATTIWERWDSMLPDGSINPGEMTSFNHYAFGAIADWLHRCVGGLDVATDGPGYRAALIAPQFLTGLEHASTAHETPYGRASVSWQRQPCGRVRVEAVVPPNTRALVHLPGVDTEVGSGSHGWTVEVRDPTASTVTVGLDTPLGRVADDADAYRAVVAALDHVDPGRARLFRKETTWSDRSTLREALKIANLPVAGVARALENHASVTQDGGELR